MATPDPHAGSAFLASRSVAELLQLLEDGTTTSVDLVEALLERIRAIDAPDSTIALRSVLAVAEDAVAQAERADALRSTGGALGPLHGIPVLIKDNVEVDGLPSTAGSTSLLNRPPHGDAQIVRRLRAAGAIVLGSTNLSEWANLRSTRSSSGWSAVGGLTANPWSTDRSAGGSSSGSGAALAAGLSPLAIGTETDGSITCPSSLNGVVGLKPTVGLLPTNGIVPLSSSQDAPGPMARTVDEVARLFAVLAESPELYNESLGSIEELRVAVAANWRTQHKETDALFDDVILRLAQAGLQVNHRTVAQANLSVGRDELDVLLAEMADDLTTYLAGRGGSPASLEEVVAFEQAHHEVELPYFGHELFIQALATGGRSGANYREARERNLEWATTGCLEPALTDVAVLLAPTYAPAWKQDLLLGEDGAKVAPTSTAPSIAGWPIATIPMGLVAGLPVGLGIIGRPNSEATILRVARFIEDVLQLRSDPTFSPTFAAPRRG